jgi:glucose-6-phosphate-specific signal transduction histidine kinase
MNEIIRVIRGVRARPFNPQRFHPRLPAQTLPWSATYGFAVLTVVISLVIKSALPEEISQGAPYLLVFSAIILSAWAGGFGPGVLATLLSGLVVYLLFLRNSESAALLTTAIFVLEGFVISLLTEYGLQSSERQERLEARLRESNKRITHLLEETLDNVDEGKV